MKKLLLISALISVSFPLFAQNGREAVTQDTKTGAVLNSLPSNFATGQLKVNGSAVTSGGVSGSNLSNGNVITGNGGSAIQDGGVALSSLQSQYQAVTFSAAGNTSSNLSANSHTAYVTANAGAGPYTATFPIPDAGRTAGDRESVHIHFAASANPTVEIHDNTSGGTLLFTWTGDGTVTDVLAECRFNGTAWYVQDAHFVW